MLYEVITNPDYDEVCADFWPKGKCVNKTKEEIKAFIQENGNNQ